MSSKPAWMFPATILLLGSFHLTACAIGLPKTGPQAIPPDGGEICVDSRTDPRGADECGRRLDAYVKRHIAATVRIMPLIYSAADGSTSGEGTGVILDDKGHVLTAYHVVQDAEYVIATLRRAKTGNGIEVGMVRSVPMEVVQTDPARDLALLRPRHRLAIEMSMEPDADWAPETGGYLWHFGQKTIGARGQVADWPVEILGITGLVALNAKSASGDSGGPVVAMDGKLVGIVLSNNESKGLTFFLPIREALPLLERQLTIERVEAEMQESRERINR